MVSVTSSSYANNSHGEGIYFSEDDLLVKGYDKIKLTKYMKQVMRASFIITHQRIATSGYEEEFVQPFNDTKNEFVLAHNGIMSEFTGKVGSDTWGFFNQFIALFQNLKGNREQKIKKAIKKLLDGKNYGSYSIVLYDKKDKILYYFKNSTTYIHFYKATNGEKLFITTECDNETFLSMFDEKFVEKDIDDLGIYRIAIKNKISIRKIGMIKDWGYEYIKDTPLSNLPSNVSIVSKKPNYYPNNKRIFEDVDDDVGSWYSNKNLQNRQRYTTAEEDLRAVFGKEAERFKNKLVKEEEQKNKKKDNELESKLLEYEEWGVLGNEGLGFKELADAKTCNDCSVLTHNFNVITGDVLCDECIDETREQLSADMTADMMEYYNQWGMDALIQRADMVK